MRKFGVIIFIITIIILIIILFLYLAIRKRQELGVTPTPTVTPTIPVNISPQLSPTGMVNIQGTVLSVSAQTIVFKNSRVVTVRTDQGAIALFVSSQSKVVDPQGNLTTRESIREGQTVAAQGTPVEGGIDVSEIRIVQGVTVISTPTFTPTPSLTFTPSPTPTLIPAT